MELTSETYWKNGTLQARNKCSAHMPPAGWDHEGWEVRGLGATAYPWVGGCFQSVGKLLICLLHL